MKSRYNASAPTTTIPPIPRAITRYTNGRKRLTRTLVAAGCRVAARAMLSFLFSEFGLSNYFIFPVILMCIFRLLIQGNVPMIKL